MAAAEVKAELDLPKETKEKCTTDPNFAVICAFIEHFGPMTGVLCPNIGRLQVCEKKSSNCSAKRYFASLKIRPL